jgi:hypothetical protein
MDDDGIAEQGDRVVLARRAPWSMVGYQWTGDEPDGLDSVGQATALGAEWEGDELVTYNLRLLTFNYEHLGFEYLEDSD